jgi:hypothetical protein
VPGGLACLFRSRAVERNLNAYRCSGAGVFLGYDRQAVRVLDTFLVWRAVPLVLSSS